MVLPVRFNLLFLGLLFLASFCFAAVCNGSVNADLTLDSDVNAIGYTGCFNVTGDFVTIDCAGRVIYGDSLGVEGGNITTAVNATGTLNFTLKNCVLRSTHQGVVLDNSNYSLIYNNTIWKQTGTSLYFYGATLGVNFSYNNVSYGSRNGVFISPASSYLTFSYNVVHGNGFPASRNGIIALANNSSFVGNNASYNYGSALHVSGGDNVVSRNWLGRSSKSSAFSLNINGFNNVIEFNNLTHTSAWSYGIYEGSPSGNNNYSYNYFEDGKNYQARIQALTGFPYTLIYNNTVVDSMGTGFWVAVGANVSYNLFINASPFYSIYGAIQVSRSSLEYVSSWVAFNTLIGSGGSSRLGSGIHLGDYKGYYLQSLGNNTIFANTIRNFAGNGINSHKDDWYFGVRSSNISYNNISDVGNASIYFQGNASFPVRDMVVHDNYLSSANNLYLGAFTANNTFFGNSFYNGSGYFVNNSNSTNYFNNSAGHGNYYSDVNSYLIVDTNDDGYGDSGPDYPYNSSQASWIGLSGDYGPIGAPYASVVTAPADSRPLTVGYAVALTGYCKSNGTITQARFWVFKNGVVYSTLTNTTTVLNATSFNEVFTAPIELMTLTWHLECTSGSFNANSTARSLSVVAVGSSGSTPSASPAAEPSASPAAPTATTVAPSTPASGGAEPSPTVVASQEPSVAPFIAPSVAAPSRGEVEALLGEVEGLMADFEGELPEEAVVKLQAAQDAYASGDYALAEQYALEARAALGVTSSIESIEGESNNLIPIMLGVLLVLGLGFAALYTTVIAA